MRFQNGVNVNSSTADGKLAEAYQNGNSNGDGHLGKLNGNAAGALKNGEHMPEHGSSASSFAMLGTGLDKHSDYFGHDRREVTRIIMQALYEMGYEESAAQLENESEYSLESRDVTEFRRAVLSGDWSRAEELLMRLGLREDSDVNILLFYLKKQKFLELLEARNLTKALAVLRNELTPLNQPSETLKHLSSLIMCLTADDLKKRAEWDGAKGTSRQRLLTELSQHISPSTMVPEHRLATLLDEVKDAQIKKCLYHNTLESPSLYSNHNCDPGNFPLHMSKMLKAHEGEAWDVQFSHDGTRFSTTSNDNTCVVWDVQTYEPLWKLEGHAGDVICSRWSPNDDKILTCSFDKTAKVWDVETGRLMTSVAHKNYPVYGATWIPDGKHFATAGPDKDLTIWDLNGQELKKWTGPRFIGLAATPDGKYLVASSADHIIYVFDLATRDIKYSMALGKYVPNISISADSRHALLSPVDDETIPLMDIETGEILRTYEGAKPRDNVIRGCFGGANENFIASGSEDENIHIWHREYGVLLAKIPGHVGVVNSVSWNPKDPEMFASAGDDGTVRIWTRPPRTSKGKIKADLRH